MKKTPEILAPAGGAEQLKAAVRAGADAVYLGTALFNARRGAENFDAQQGLPRAVEYCRARGVKVYVTLNTLVREDEIGLFAREAELIARSGADAVIVQDLAAARIVKEICPSLALHASTQMTIHNTAGVRLLKAEGFSRIVPARELSLPEIAALANEADIQTEVFVHGALCMSVSGCCYLSSMLGGRSGNRGLCAQPCRLDFHAGGRSHALSLKDMSYIDRIGELEKAGVDSLKIEGRMKRPEYVAAAVDACVRARDGEKYDAQKLADVFSRSGFTDGYLTGKRDVSMFGYRRHEDVTAATEKVFSSLAQLYRAERKTVPVDMTLTLREGGRSLLLVSDGVHEVTVSGEVPEKAHNRPTDADSAGKNLSKTGDTPYYTGNISVINGDGLILSAAAVNALRREALSELEAEAGKSPVREIKSFEYTGSRHISSERKTYLRFSSAVQLFSNDADMISLPVSELKRVPELIEKYGERLSAELPSLIFPADEDKIKKELCALRDAGLKAVTVNNIGAIELVRGLGFRLIGGFGLNILNSVALKEYERLGLSEAVVSFEISARSAAEFDGGIRRGAAVYGYLPLMKYRCCPLKGERGCGECEGGGVTQDRFGTPFRIMCREKKYSVLLNSVPLDIIKRPVAEMDFDLLYFTCETAAESADIYNVYKNKNSVEGKKTNGLYYRELI